MNPIPERLAQVKQLIATCARSCERDPTEITLIAVSKTKPVESILAAYNAGQRDFGENYLQEAEAKINQLKHLAIRWHYIGRIQSNKTRSIAMHFDWVHALSSIKHARRLNEQRPGQLKPLNLCIQLNLTGEESKGGIQKSELPTLLEQTKEMTNIRIRGLMTMPPAGSSEQEQSAIFSDLRQLLEDMQQRGHAMDTLSMGMSGDMAQAICQGATMVRIGTAIFGARS